MHVFRPYPIFSSKSEIIGHVDVKVSMQALHSRFSLFCTHMLIVTYVKLQA